MDDSLFLCKTYNEAISILKEYKDISNKLHININLNKTKIIPITNSFMFCKWRYYLSNCGDVYLFACRDTIYRQRRKLRKMINKNIDIEDIIITITSYCAYLNHGNNYNKIKYLKSLLL